MTISDSLESCQISASKHRGLISHMILQNSQEVVDPVSDRITRSHLGGNHSQTPSSGETYHSDNDSRLSVDKGLFVVSLGW